MLYIMCCNDIIEKIMDCICAKITRLYVSLPIVTTRLPRSQLQLFDTYNKHDYIQLSHHWDVDF